MLYGPLEVGRHGTIHGSRNAREERDADVSSKEVSCSDMRFQMKRHVLYPSCFQETQVKDDLNSEYIELSPYNDSPSADIEVKWIIAIEI